MENKFDGVLSQMVQSYKGYEGFFDSVFGFLRRKTDFYQNSKQAETICFKAADKHLKLYQKQKKAETAKKQQEKARKEERQKQKKPETPIKPKTPTKTKKNLETSKPETEKDKKSQKLTPNKGNGSKTRTYYWVQTLEDLTINIPLPAKTKSKQLTVKIQNTNLLVESKDKKTTYIKGNLFDKIHTDDSLWTISTNEGNRILEIVLTKWKGSMKWWDCVVEGEPPIDCQKINPEPSKLGDLDGEMRGTVEKMMFDMRQKEKGMPSSDELQKQEKMKEFMKLHPEMDFSNAKFG